MTVAPDGTFWILSGPGLVHFVPGGSTTEFPIPLVNGAWSGPSGIAFGPDGNLWITEGYGNQVLRISPSDPTVISTFQVPTPGGFPGNIVAGPDGNLWFAETSGTKIGRVAPNGIITEFSTPTPASEPYSITVGADGNLWFSEFNFSFSGGHFVSSIGRITPLGVVTEFPIPTPIAGTVGIATGSDGNVWFVERIANQIGRITPEGAIAEFPIPSPMAELSAMTAGPDGRIWFAEDNYSRVGVFDPADPTSIQELPLPSARLEIAGFANGFDGNLWAAEFYPHNALIRINLAPLSFFPVTPCRAFDTRNPLGPSGGPSLVSEGIRTFPVANICNIPSTAHAIAANLTVTNTGADGSLQAYAGGEPPPVIDFLTFRAGVTRANNGVIAVGGDGSVAIGCLSTRGADVILDVTGFFE